MFHCFNMYLKMISRKNFNVVVMSQLFNLQYVHKLLHPNILDNQNPSKIYPRPLYLKASIVKVKRFYNSCFNLFYKDIS
jgi:hypothetical protein